MKILQVFDLMSPKHGGGTVDVISKLSHGLAKRGHDITVCTSDYELKGQYVSPICEIKMDLYHNYGRFCGIYFTPEVRKVDVRKYDVIHFHCLRSFQNAILCKKAIKYDIPYVIDAHGSAPKLNKHSLKTIYDIFIGNTTYKHCSSFIAETAIGGTEYKTLGIAENRISVIHTPVEIDDFKDLPTKGMFKQKHNIKTEYIILFMGRINQIKGLAFLIKSFKKLCTLRDDATLVLAGSDDGYLTELSKLINQLGLKDKVKYVGYIDGVEKKSALVDSSMLIQPSIREQGSRPGYEAILCDIPVIATKGTGAGEDIEKVNGGLIVEHGNEDEMCTAMNTLLNPPNSIINKLALAKQWIKDNVSPEATTINYENLYKDIIKRRA